MYISQKSSLKTAIYIQRENNKSPTFRKWTQYGRGESTERESE